MRVADAAHSRRRHVDRIVAELRHLKLAEQYAAVGVGIRAHAVCALRRKLGQFRLQPALLIEELLGPVAPQPLFKLLEMFGRRRGGYGERNLVRSERALDWSAVHDFRPGPAFGRIEDNERPARTRRVAVNASVLLDLLDLLHRRVERRGHGLVHWPGLVTLDEVGRPAIAAE